MKIVTADFGIVETKPKKVFEHNSIKYAIVEAPYKYMNSSDTSYMTKCVHFETGWQIPVFNNHKATIKSFIESSKNTLDNLFKDLGEDKFFMEINSKEKLN